VVLELRSPRKGGLSALREGPEMRVHLSVVIKCRTVRLSVVKKTEDFKTTDKFFLSHENVAFAPSPPKRKPMDHSTL
jgi:hypothetical protein